jgi:serine-type D-Ala-D-Ala carboxypeptidase/endopeptidase
VYRICAFLVLAGCSAPPAAPPSLRAAVDAAVPAVRPLSLAVGVLKDGRSEVLGYGALPPDGRTLFEIGSITKVFTAQLLVQLAAEGRVSLDDAVQRHVPPGWVVPSREGRPITLVQLATHTSGLPRLPDNLGARDLRNPYADYNDDRLRAFLAGHVLGRSPGGRYAYSNLGAGLLGWILARVDGRSYEDAVVARLCDPLGLRDTRIRLDPDQRRRLAPPTADGKPGWNWDIPVISGAGALRSTPDDLLRFLAAQFDGSPAHAPRVKVSDAGTWVGLGWHISPLPQSGRTMVWHNGGTGGYRSFAGVVKESRTAVVVLANSTEDVDPLGVALLELLQR